MAKSNFKMKDETIFSKLNDMLSDPHDLEETCREIIVFALKVSKADYCALIVTNPIDNCIVRIFSQNKEMSNSFISSDKDKITLQDADQKVLNKSGVVSINITSENTQCYKEFFSASSKIKSLIALKLLTPRGEHQKTLGQMYLGYEKKCKNIELEKEFGRRISKEASSALQHTWSIRRYKDVAKLGQEINKELKDTEQIFEQLVQHLPKILNSNSYFMMGVHNQEVNKLDFYLLEKNVRRNDLNFVLEGACKYVIDNNEPLFIHNHKKERLKLEEKGIVVVHRNKSEKTLPDSMMFVPLTIRERTLGVLSVQQYQANAFDSEDRQILELLSHYTALAISNLRWKKGLEDLIKTGQELTQELDAVNSMRHVVDLIRRQTKADIVSLHPYDYRLGRFVFPVIYSGKFINKDFPQPETALPDDSASLALRGGEAIFCKSSNLSERLRGNSKTRNGRFETREAMKSVAVLPLQLGGKPVGILFLNFREEQLFTASRKNLIEGLALFVAISIINSSTFQDAKGRIIKNSEALRKIDRKIIETNDRSEIFDTILSATKENLQNKGTGNVHGTILIYDKAKNALIVENHAGENERIRLGKSISLAKKEGLTYHAWKKRTVIRVGNVKEDKRYLRIDENTWSEMDIPIIEKGRAIGVISFESNRKDFFTQNDEDFAEIIANQVVVGIKKTESFENERRAKEHELAIGAVAKKIIEDNLNFKRVVQLILHKSLELTESDAGVVLLHDKDQRDYYIGAEQNIKPEKKSERLPEDKGLTGWTMQNKRSLIANVKQSPWKEIYQPWVKDKGIEWALVVPMLKGSRKLPVGVIVIEGKSKFTNSDKYFLEELAPLAVIALENAQNYEKVEEAVKTLRILNEAGKQLGEIVDIDSLKTAYKIISKKIQKDRSTQVVIRWYEMETQELRKVDQAKKQTPPPFDLININEEAAIYDAFQKRKTILIPDRDNPPPEFKKLKISGADAKSLVIVWITFQDKIYGSISLSHPKNDYFQEIDLKLIEGLAQLLGSTINRLEMEKQSRELEVVATVGEIAYELAHRIGNYLGWAEPYFGTIMNSEKQIDEKMLHNLIDRVAQVVKQSRKTKQVFTSLRYIKKETIPTNVLIDQIKESLPKIKDDIEIIWTIAPKLPNLFVVVPHIESIINNLVINAAEAISEKGKIEIEAQQIEGYVEIKIIDDGCGIDKETLAKIFDLNFTTRTNKENTGFGLWSAKRSAFANGGDLTVESQLGTGTTFTLILPVQVN